jgi:hypothetical protein
MFRNTFGDIEKLTPARQAGRSTRLLRSAHSGGER